MTAALTSASVFVACGDILFLKDLLLVFGPNIHELPRFVHLHRIVHQTVHVDKLDSPLFQVVHHWWDDRKLSHLFFIVLWNRGRDAFRPQINAGCTAVRKGTVFCSSFLKDTTSGVKLGESACQCCTEVEHLHCCLPPARRGHQ